MTLQNFRRKRGVLLTPKGLQKLQEAKLHSEAEENYGMRYTLEEMSDRSGLYTATISKVLNREGGVDRKTIEALFESFNINLDKTDYLSSNTRIDWGEAIFASGFYGRTEELSTLEQWILDQRSRVVGFLGMGGIGKTSLSVKLAQQIQNNFEYVIWRSLQDAPPVDAIVANLIQFLSNGKDSEADLPDNLSQRISRLMDYLSSSRCLVILDNLESILSSGTRSGQYRKGYEGYGELIKRLGEATHISCLVITSREQPKEFAFLKAESVGNVRCLKLHGLKALEGKEIFKVKGISAPENELEAVVERYAGNPLALKIVANTIQNVFDGNVGEFLRQETAVFGDIRDILEQQFERLSALEKEIIYWLAINREQVSFAQVQSDILLPVSPAKLIDAAESLLRRSLVEKTAFNFTLQPVVMEYVTQRLVESVCEEITTENLDLFRCHALMKALSKEYIKEAQVRLIIKPVINGLLASFRSKRNMENQLKKIIATLREESPLEPSYTAGNIINLLCHLPTDLTGYDFSNLAIWQADLGSVNLHNVNLANADLTKCVFAETFGGIFSVAISCDRQLLATGDTNGEIRFYQVANGQPLLTCQGHTGWVWSVSFHPDGHILASGGNDHKVKLWDTNTGQCLATLEGHSGGVRSVAFSWDGHLIASSSDDSSIKIWDSSTGECLNTLEGNGCSVWSVAFSSKDYTLASGDEDYQVRLWDINSGLCIRTLQGHSKRVYSITFSPDGQTVASGSHDHTIRCWDVSTGQCTKILQGHTDLVHSVAFSADGSILASGSDDTSVRVWDVDSGECLQTLKGHSNRVWGVSFYLNNLLASSSDDQTVKLWNISTSQCIKTLHGYNNGIWSVAVSPDGKMIASGCNDSSVKLWDITTGNCVKTCWGHSSRVTSVAFSANGHIIASGSEDGTIRLWDVNTGQCLKILRGHSNRVSSVTFTAGGNFIVSGSDDQTIRVWDMDSGESLKILRGHTGRAWSVSCNTHTLASGGHDHIVKIWDVATSECVKTLQGHKDWVWGVTLSCDGHILASGSGDQTVKIWDVRTSECLLTLQGHTNSIYSVAFSPDSQILASGGGDKTVKIWDVSTGSCLRTLLGHTRWIWSVTFSPDGQTVISCSEDEMIKIWDVQTGECVKTLRSKGIYENMNIMGVTGLTESQKVNLKALGAIE